MIFVNILFIGLKIKIELYINNGITKTYGPVYNVPGDRPNDYNMLKFYIRPNFYFKKL